MIHDHTLSSAWPVRPTGVGSPHAGVRAVALAVFLGVVAVGAARAQTGACCPSCDLEECVITTEEECETLLGFYGGDGTVCEDCPMPSTIPDPSNSSVAPADALNGLFVCPSAPLPIVASTLHVTVRNNCNDPIVGAFVSVELTDLNPTCGSGGIAGVTNSAGEVTLVVAGGGCAHEEPLSGLIKANGVVIRAYSNVKSPDLDANRVVGLADLVSFSNDFLGVTASSCHDYDNDGTTSLPDLVLFSFAFVAANHCP